MWQTISVVFLRRLLSPFGSSDRREKDRLETVASTMPVQLPPCKLSGMEPTAKEVEEAEANIRKMDKDQLRSLKGCVNNFLKNNPEADLSGKEMMQKVMRNFVIHQHQVKNAQKKMGNERVVGLRSEKTHKVIWMSWKKMNDELGEEKAEDWRECGKLRWRPDSMTGKTEVKKREYAIPQDYETMTESDWNAMKTFSEQEGKVEDMDAMDSFAKLYSLASVAASSSSGVEGAGLVTVKEEKKSDADILKEKMQALIANPQAQATKYTEYQLKLLQMQRRSQDQRMAQTLHEACKAILPVVVEVTDTFKDMINVAPKASKLPSLLKLCDRVEFEFKDILFHSEGLNCAPDDVKKGKKRKADPNGLGPNDLY